MRFRLCRIAWCLGLVTLGTCLYILVRALTLSKYTQTCNRSQQFHQALHNLAERAHVVLAGLGLTHFLCYGSLWGQLRESKSLPWESDVELCLLNEELAGRDEVYLARAFRSQLMSLEYDSANGVYSVTDTNLPGASVQLIVFETEPLGKMAHRVGWKRRVLAPDCGSPSLGCFPRRLINPPLPLREFGPSILPVPREGIEIQKFHYPTNWWKQTLPKNC